MLYDIFNILLAHLNVLDKKFNLEFFPPQNYKHLAKHVMFETPMAFYSQFIFSI